MNVSVCPSCQAQVLPGQPTCRACGHDFILGRRPSAPPAVPRAVLLGAGGLVLVTGLILALQFVETEGPAVPTCVDILAALREPVRATAAGGAAIPHCELTPPGPRGCWDAAGLNSTNWPNLAAVQVRLQGGFRWEIDCQEDADEDGIPAVWRATEEVAGIRVSGNR